MPFGTRTEAPWSLNTYNITDFVYVLLVKLFSWILLQTPTVAVPYYFVKSLLFIHHIMLPFILGENEMKVRIRILRAPTAVQSPFGKRKAAGGQARSSLTLFLINIKKYLRLLSITQSTCRLYFV